MADINQQEIENRRQARHESHAMGTYKQFLKDLQNLAGLHDEQQAERAAVSVIGVFEQRIYGEAVRDLEAQLPSILRELLQHGERHEGKPTKKFGSEELFNKVAADLGMDRAKVEPLVRAVVATVRAHITEGEAQNISDQLPSDMAELWMLPA